ncbi:hypothetical protein B0H13DRAFT_2081247 [Mycena leptocephala]|nr:hypothetical protein B0H13DRAFT_2081247 [Mycena leptocephala]
MGEPRHTGTAQKKAFAATQDKCVKKLVQVTAGALTNEALHFSLCLYNATTWIFAHFTQLDEIVVQDCLMFFRMFGEVFESEDKVRLHYSMQCLHNSNYRITPASNSQNALITTCTSILKRHLIFERFHSIQVGAAICMCAQQIFFDGSAKKRTFTSAFERAVVVFSKQASASGFLDEIEPWVDRRTEDMTNLDHDYMQRTNMAQEVVDMIKKYRPLIFGEAKG